MRLTGAVGWPDGPLGARTGRLPRTLAEPAVPWLPLLLTGRAMRDLVATPQAVPVCVSDLSDGAAWALPAI